MTPPELKGIHPMSTLQTNRPELLARIRECMSKIMAIRIIVCKA